MDSFAPSSSFHLHQRPFSYPLSKQRLYPLPPTSISRVSKSPSLQASSSKSNPHPISRTLKTIGAGAILLSAAAVSSISGHLSPALAEPPASSDPAETPKTLDSLRSLLYEKLEEGDDAEALSILRRLLSSHPSEPEWKLLAARLLNEIGEASESRKLLEEILAADPLSFEALFENAVLMDRCGEGEAAVGSLERALEFARAEGKEAAARDVRLIIAQIQYLRRKVEEALLVYDELAREDPKDYRPFFCQGVIYTLLDRNREAREKFAKYNELTERKAEVNAYLQTPLSRVRLFGTGDSGI